MVISGGREGVAVNNAACRNSGNGRGIGSAEFALFKLI